MDRYFQVERVAEVSIGEVMDNENNMSDCWRQWRSRYGRGDRGDGQSFGHSSIQRWNLCCMVSITVHSHSVGCREGKVGAIVDRVWL